MSFNFSVFRVRALSAIVFVIVMIGGLIWNNWSFFSLFVVIATGCLYEFQKLLGLISPAYKNKSAIHKWGLLLLGAAIMFTLSKRIIILDPNIFKIVGLYVVPAIICIIVLADVFSKKFSLQNMAISMVGLIYIPMGLSLFYQIRSLPTSTYYQNANLYIPLLIIISVWVNDTMAYLVGSVIGRNPLSTISPNKTWEGTIGGVILAVMLVTKVTGYYLPDLSTSFVFMVCLIAAVAGNYGDLMESKLKRLAGVKDSGSMMPGHGGFLDRFDSILLATPFVWLLLQIFY
jgi:phosphatidate cytidylyltransferase